MIHSFKKKKKKRKKRKKTLTKEDKGVEDEVDEFEVVVDNYIFGRKRDGGRRIGGRKGGTF